MKVSHHISLTYPIDSSGFVKFSVFLHILDCSDVLLTDDTALKEFTVGDNIAYKETLGQLFWDKDLGLWSVGFKVTSGEIKLEKPSKARDTTPTKARLATINLKKLNESNEDSASVCQKATSLFDKVLGDKTRVTDAKTRPKTNSIAGSGVSRKSNLTSIAGRSAYKGENEVFSEPSVISKTR